MDESYEKEDVSLVHQQCVPIWILAAILFCIFMIIIGFLFLSACYHIFYSIDSNDFPGRTTWTTDHRTSNRVVRKKKRVPTYRTSRRMAIHHVSHV